MVLAHAVGAANLAELNSPHSFAVSFRPPHTCDTLRVLVVLAVLLHYPKAKTKSAPHHEHNGDILNRHGVVSFLLALRNKISLARLSNLRNHESKQTFGESCTSPRTSESVAVGSFIIKQHRVTNVLDNKVFRRAILNYSNVFNRG